MTPRLLPQALGLAFLLAGCAAPKPIAAVTDLGTRTCPTHPSSVGASKLSLDPESARKATVDIGPDAPCLQTEQGADSLYHVFLLPASDKDMMATVTSLPTGHTLFAPRLLLFDSSGKMTRDIGVTSFLYRYGGLTALVRLHSGEQMLVVASAPSVVGQPVTRLQEQVANQVVSAYPLLVEIHTGSDVKSDYVMSHTGRVMVDIKPLPSVELNQ